MQKKSIVLMTLMAILLCFSATQSFAENKAKTVIINMNRTSLKYMYDIPVLKKELDSRGYIGLMNIRGDGGNTDERSYASIGAGAKANISTSKGLEEFREATNENSQIYTSATGNISLAINNPGINKTINYNSDKGQYGATLGSLGQSLTDNNLKVAVLGNSDIGFEEEDYNRSFALMAMDESGRIPLGNIDDINIKDSNMPFGIKTDYEKLKDYTSNYYTNSDVLFVDLGDTYRLDKYKSYLSTTTYNAMKDSIYKNINNYLSYVFDLYKNDNVYIMSAYPNSSDYSDRYRLTPLIKFTNNKKGLLCSATTRRDGILSNVDLGVDILGNYGIKNSNMVGKSFSYLEKEDNIEYLNHDYDKIVTISSTRANMVNFFVVLVALSWVISAILLVVKNKIPEDKKGTIFNVLKEFIKLGMIMPLAFLIAPITNASTPLGVFASIVGCVLVIGILGHLVFKKNDIKQMGLYAFLIITLIALDSIFGSYLMKNDIMSYDALIGARYYGIGNEYEGVTVASAIFALSAICHYKKPSNWIFKGLMSIFLIFVLITSAHPSMGANVGGAISETVAYLVFIAMLFDIKIDFKKFIIILMLAGLVVTGFAVADIVMGTESHLSLFVNKILLNGPSEIIQTFSRKITMNIKLAKTSIWANLLLIGIIIVAGSIFKPGKNFGKMRVKYPMIFKGFSASMVGCITTLLVNDSGIVAASTASIYILIPLIIMLINIIIFKDKNEKA